MNNETGYAVTRVLGLRDDSVVVQGSGFFYLQHRGDGQQLLHLVTNRHLLAGGEAHSPAGHKLDALGFHFHLEAGQRESTRFIRIPLTTRGRKPVWLDGGMAGDADLIAVPIPPALCADCRIQYLEAATALGQGPPPGPLTSIHVAGFPSEHYDDENLWPVWQTGVLASDAGTDFRGTPTIAVEMPTYPGMAGAPAFAVETRQTPGQAGQQPRLEPVGRFLGVYTGLPMAADGRFAEALWAQGRAGVVARDAGIWGRIWKARVIEQILGAFEPERWEREVLADLE